MKNSDRIKITLLFISITLAGCASNGGERVFGTVDQGLETVGRTADTGRAVMQAGRTAATGVPAQQAVLTDVLVNQLGVSRQQALGGAGAIFQAAKAKMAPQAFNNLSQSIPDMSDMLAAAPQVGPPLSKTMPAVGDVGGSIDTMTSLAASFQHLNMPQSMVNQFIPVVVDYVRTTSGPTTANLLQSALVMH
ncbi:DUF2780 domain-containing protein [Candidatus Methylomicrobium oryzae]|jgi:hypothetical protein|uniref:DUF2780 domain-containing protein n=1 Tax=Candidatus Methylomicrobium oryzae TaxID=2802053 RepID=UPI0019219918|nr:DUF2780 domain-containing protein [Methylomicrobium sp. RS1]MBL1264803.1 DUF2780 domain-containing protein [Methylomicrobium sp. RS1]